MIRNHKYTAKYFAVKISICLNAILVSGTMFLFGGLGLVFGIDIKDIFDVSKEIKLSNADMICLRYSRYYKYPKIIVDNETPKIFFFDDSSGRLIISEISDDGIQFTRKIEGFYKNKINESDDKWSMILEGNQVYLSDINRYKSRTNGYIYDIFIYSLYNNPDMIKLETKYSITGKNIAFHKFGHISDIYPFDGLGRRFLIVGEFTEGFFHPLGLFSGHMPSFKKNYSLIIEDQKIQSSQRIESKGRFGVGRMEFAVSHTGIAHCAWIRTWCDGVGFSKKTDKTICYSTNEKGLGWSQPIQLIDIASSESILFKGISITCDQNRAYIAWQNSKQGLFFAEVKNREIIEKKLVVPIEIKNDLHILWLKMTVDREGNLFVLMNKDFGYGHEMTICCRVFGEWTGPYTISSGHASIIRFDIKKDKSGNIHLVYLKESSRKQEYKCYYRKLSKVYGSLGLSD